MKGQWNDVYPRSWFLDLRFKRWHSHCGRKSCSLLGWGEVFPTGLQIGIAMGCEVLLAQSFANSQDPTWLGESSCFCALCSVYLFPHWHHLPLRTYHLLKHLATSSCALESQAQLDMKKGWNLSWMGVPVPGILEPETPDKGGQPPTVVDSVALASGIFF